MDSKLSDLHELLREASGSFDVGVSAIVLSTPEGRRIVHGLDDEIAAFASASFSEFFKEVLFPRGAPTIILDTRKSCLSADPCVTGGPCLRFYMEATLQDGHGSTIGALVLADQRARDGFSDEDLDRLEEYARLLQVAVETLMVDMGTPDEAERCCRKTRDAWPDKMACLRGHASRVQTRGTVPHDKSAKHKSAGAQVDPRNDHSDRMQEGVRESCETIPGHSDSLSTADTDGEAAAFGSGLRVVQ